MTRFHACNRLVYGTNEIISLAILPLQPAASKYVCQWARRQLEPRGCYVESQLEPSCHLRRIFLYLRHVLTILPITFSG
jgi:hypothetical protein